MKVKEVLRKRWQKGTQKEVEGRKVERNIKEVGEKAERDAGKESKG